MENASTDEMRTMRRGVSVMDITALTDTDIFAFPIPSRARDNQPSSTKAVRAHPRHTPPPILLAPGRNDTSHQAASERKPRGIRPHPNTGGAHRRDKPTAA
jgi:hypothetical protein